MDTEFGEQNIDQFLMERYNKNDLKYKYASKMVDFLRQEYNNVINVLGDGNCLIYSIIFTLYYENSQLLKNIIQNIQKMYNSITTHEIEDAYKNIKLVDDKKIRVLEEQYGKFDIDLQLFDIKELEKILLQSDVLLKIANQLRVIVYVKWNYIGYPVYHISDNAIDGLAIDLICRIIGITKLTIYILDSNTTKVIKPTLKMLSENNISCHILTQDRTHYAGLSYNEKQIFNEMLIDMKTPEIKYPIIVEDKGINNNIPQIIIHSRNPYNDLLNNKYLRPSKIISAYVNNQPKQKINETINCTKVTESHVYYPPPPYPPPNDIHYTPPPYSPPNDQQIKTQQNNICNYPTTQIEQQCVEQPHSNQQQLLTHQKSMYITYKSKKYQQTIIKKQEHETPVVSEPLKNNKHYITNIQSKPAILYAMLKKHK